MDILVLEDVDAKYSEVYAHLNNSVGNVSVVRAKCFVDFLRFVERQRFDLIVVDLLVPRFKDSPDVDDVTAEILDACRDSGCTNKGVPILALTAFYDASDNNYKSLNAADIAVLIYDPDGRWKEALGKKCFSARPKKVYDVVIVCALSKEVDGFVQAGYAVGNSFIAGNLVCREIAIGDCSGIIVTAARMGLVSCAITSTQALEVFSPRLICMSGICAGIDGKASILDVAIAEICHQHDFGKWSVNGYEPEVYAVPIKPKLRAQLKQIIEDDPGFRTSILHGITVKDDELPEGMSQLQATVYLTPASSGSAVIADAKMVEVIKEQQRKGVIFEMESFALYEAARLHPSEIPFFSAKAVVDNGSASKGDKFHRLACILSAKVVFESIKRLAKMPDSSI